MWLHIGAEQLIEILSKWPSVRSKTQELQFMASRYVKQTLWRYRDELAHESHSQDVRGHFHCKQNANISIPTNIMTHIVCQNNCNIVFFFAYWSAPLQVWRHRLFLLQLFKKLFETTATLMVFLWLCMLLQLLHLYLPALPQPLSSHLYSAKTHPLCFYYAPCNPSVLMMRRKSCLQPDDIIWVITI